MVNVNIFFTNDFIRVIINVFSLMFFCFLDFGRKITLFL